jgi:O-antigen ligase
MQAKKKRKPDPPFQTGQFASVKPAIGFPPTKCLTLWIICLVIVLPLLFSRTTMDPALSIRYFFMSVFILLLALSFFVLRKTVVIAFNANANITFLLGIVYGTWCLITIPNAINVGAAVYECLRYWLSLLFLFIVVMAFTPPSQHVLTVSKALLIVGFIQGMIGILQQYQLAFLNLPGVGTTYGLMTNRNLYGSGQLLLLPFTIYVLYKGNKAWKYAAAVALSAAFVAIVISQTRSVWLGTLVFIVLSGLLGYLFSPGERRKWIVSCIATILMLAVVTLLIFLTSRDVNFRSSMRSRIESVTQLKLNTDERSSEAQRLELWGASLQIIKDHPWLGVGAGNWNVAVRPYGAGILSWSSGNYMPGSPHNTYLQVASDSGLPGVLMYIAFWMMIVVTGIKTIRKTRSADVRIITILMTSGIVAFLIDAVFNFSAERIEHTVFVSCLAGIILSQREHSEKSTNIRVGNWLAVVVVSIAALNALVGYKKYVFEQAMLRSVIYRRSNLFEQVLKEVEKGQNRWVTIAYNGDPLELHSSVAFRELGNYQKSYEEIEQAIYYHPYNPRLYNVEGVLFSTLKEYDKAIASFEKALELTPAYEAAIKNLAMVYFESRQYRKCIKTLGKISIQNDTFFVDLLKKAETLAP